MSLKDFGKVWMVKWSEPWQRRTWPVTWIHSLYNQHMRGRWTSSTVEMLQWRPKTTATTSNNSVPRHLGFKMSWFWRWNLYGVAENLWVQYFVGWTSVKTRLSTHSHLFRFQQWQSLAVSPPVLFCHRIRSETWTVMDMWIILWARFSQDSLFSIWHVACCGSWHSASDFCRFLSCLTQVPVGEIWLLSGKRLHGKSPSWIGKSTNSMHHFFNTGWWFGTFCIFPYIGNFIIPIDFHIFQRGGPTTNQLC